jgi:hypothetical protein
VPGLRPPSAPPGGLVKTRQQRKNPPRFGVHLGNPGLEQTGSVPDIEIELLTDIKEVFDANPQRTEISTKSLITELGINEERPWATFSKGGKPITDRLLAKMVGKYGIISEDVYPSGTHAKGYKRVRFEDAWGRYS